MLAMQLETKLDEKTQSLQLGEEWIRAITDGMPEGVERICQPQVASRLLTPKRNIQYENAADLAAKLRQWFGECREFQTEYSRVELVGERLGIHYRFRLREKGQWLTIEQQLYCTLEAGRIASLELLCSGFHPVKSQEQPAADEAQAEQASEGRAVLVFHTAGSKNASTCAVLTPAIKAKLRDMESRQVLEVRVDDLEARQDIEAWCRMSGNRLVGMNADGGTGLQFFVQKK